MSNASQSLDQLQLSHQALETRVASLEAVPTPTPTPTATPTPTPTPTPGPLADYQPVLDVLGPTGVILPRQDADTGGFASSFQTVGAIPATLTWGGLPFDTAPTSQGSVPVVTFNGTDEEADSPDADYWSAGADGTALNEPLLSIGAWVNMVDSTHTLILSKNGGVSGEQEWTFSMNASDQPVFRIIDDSTAADANVLTTDDTAIVENVWVFVVVTYGGTATPAGMNIYRDGVLVASTDTDNVNYVAMENTPGPLRLGFGQTNESASNFFDGRMAGGPCGPFFTHKELSAADVAQLYDYCRGLMGLP